MEGITGWEYEEVWLKGKLELERNVIGHSWDFILPITLHPMHYEQVTCFDSFHCSFFVELQNLNLHQYSNINVTLDSHYDSVQSLSLICILMLTRCHVDTPSKILSNDYVQNFSCQYTLQA